MNKNTLIGALVLLVLVLGYYGFHNKEEGASLKESAQATTKDETKDYFAQNQDCLKYKTEIAKRLETKESPFGEASLEQIFYSPKVNSCLYVRFEDLGYSTAPFQSHLIRSLYDVLNDGYNSRPLEQCIVIEPGENCDNFDEKIEGYRK